MSGGEPGYPEALLALGLGLASWTPVLTEADLHMAAQTYDLRQSARADVLEGRKVEFGGLDGLRNAVSGSDVPLIIAATELGDVCLSIAALARCGVRIATPFWDIAEQYRKLADLFEAELIDLNQDGDPRRVAHSLRLSQRMGLVPFLLVEAPSRSPRRFTFMGGQIRCSRFLCWLARETGSRVLLLWNRQDRFGRVDLGFELLTPGTASTQVLLDRIGAEVHTEPAQYAWENAAVLFSQDGASRRAFKAIEMILEWRRKRLVDRPQSEVDGAACTITPRTHA